MLFIEAKYKQSQQISNLIYAWKNWSAELSLTPGISNVFGLTPF